MPAPIWANMSKRNGNGNTRWHTLANGNVAVGAKIGSQYSLWHGDLLIVDTVPLYAFNMALQRLVDENPATPEQRAADQVPWYVSEVPFSADYQTGRKSL